MKTCSWCLIWSSILEVCALLGCHQAACPLVSSYFVQPLFISLIPFSPPLCSFPFHIFCLSLVLSSLLTSPKLLRMDCFEKVIGLEQEQQWRWKRCNYLLNYLSCIRLKTRWLVFKLFLETSPSPFPCTFFGYIGATGFLLLFFKSVVSYCGFFELSFYYWVSSI